MPGTEIEVQRTGKQKSKYDKATVVTLTDEYGLTETESTSDSESTFSLLFCVDWVFFKNRPSRRVFEPK